MTLSKEFYRVNFSLIIAEDIMEMRLRKYNSSVFEYYVVKWKF